jgi:uncharacterized membrane protein SpoIIM required for sporulation
MSTCPKPPFDSNRSSDEPNILSRSGQISHKIPCPIDLFAGFFKIYNTNSAVMVMYVGSRFGIPTLPLMPDVDTRFK